MKRKSILILLFLLVGMSALYIGIYFMDYTITNKVSKIEEQIQEMEEIQGLNQEINKKRDYIITMDKVIYEMSKSHVNYYDLLERMKELLPKGITFTSLSAEEGTMNIKGLATAQEEVAELAANLYQLEEVHDVWIHSADYRDQIQFELSFLYATNEGEQNELK